jgi:hypothetical protein
MSFVKISKVPTFVVLMHKLTDFDNPQRKVHITSAFLSKFTTTRATRGEDFRN